MCVVIGQHPYNSLRWFGCIGLAVYPFYVVEYTQLEAWWTASHGTSSCALDMGGQRERVRGQSRELLYSIPTALCEEIASAIG